MVERLTRVVIKVGSSVLTDERGRLLPARLERLVEQLAACRKDRELLLVSSGAIACGMGTLGLRQRPRTVQQLQVCAAVGQSELMHRYTVAFKTHGLTIAQVLLTQEDFAKSHRYRNATKTLLTLLRLHVVPIVNENDTVAVEEITFGDNDRLAALVACAVDAQLLVILSDVEGLLRDGALIERVEGVDHTHHAAVHASRRETTTGGMTSKLAAARIVGHDGISMVIANGTRPEVLTDLLAGRPVGTLFVPPQRSRVS